MQVLFRWRRTLASTDRVLLDTRLEVKRRLDALGAFMPERGADVALSPTNTMETTR